MGKSLRFFDCILVSMPGLDGVLPIASTTCCPSFERTKSMNNFAALLCGAFAATPIGCKDTVTGSRVVTHSTGASLFLHFFYSVGQYHCHGKLPHRHELRNQGLTSAELDILFCQSFHETLRLFSSPGHGHGCSTTSTSPHPWRSCHSIAGQADRPNFLELRSFGTSFVL